MKSFVQHCKTFWKDEEGLTVVEYVIGAALLAIALGVMFQNWGQTLLAELNSVFP